MFGPIVLAVFLAQAATAPPVAPPSQQPPVSPATQVAPDQPWPPPGVPPPGNGVTTPRAIKERKPAYTADAMREKIQGIVRMEGVVEPDGTVGPVHVTQSLDTVYGLDDEAVTAFKQWLFQPGMKDGVAVRVLIKVDMTFTRR